MGVETAAEEPAAVGQVDEPKLGDLVHVYGGEYRVEEGLGGGVYRLSCPPMTAVSCELVATGWLARVGEDDDWYPAGDWQLVELED